MGKFKALFILLMLTGSMACPVAQPAQGIFRLSNEDSIALANLPELELPDFLKKNTLPAQLDNSDEPYFRDLFEQVSNECGQYAAIAFNFTYEINYRRGIPANTPENQYPTHFTYNFQNGGYGWHGVSYFHSFEIVRTNGEPNVADYGGVAEGGPSRWLSGYDKYYNGLFNRVDQVYQIYVGTPEGLLTLKNWLHNHLEGAEVGGIACFYSPSPWNTVLLPEGTPEGGKHVITRFSGTAGHASPITGWNDSIRFDYNLDGQYTNNIDINNDGIIDMRDWETGGLLFTDSYLGGVNWADSGFCFMMYKTLADNVYDGGIWNHAVHVVKVKENYQPLVTYKITFKHTARETIKVLAGIASDSDAGNPTRILGFPIFDYQGGFQYMQGGTWLEQNKTIEFGLDITPLLGEINSGEPARFFLLVDERDPDHLGDGEIVNFSVMDYTNGTVEHTYPITNISLQDNGLTTIYLNAEINFNQLEISDDELPPALTSDPYSHQLTASGGTPPYKWRLLKHYDQEGFAGEMPPIEGSQIEPNDNESGFGLQVLDFSFPFYGKTYDTVYVHVDGFLKFDKQYFPWPYLYDEQMLIRKVNCIAPYLNRNQKIDPDQYNGLWYEGDETHVTFWWKTSIPGLELQDVEYAVLLFPNGEFEFYYELQQDIFKDNIWAAGISNGDNFNYLYTDLEPAPGTPKIFTAEEFPDELSLSKDGIFSGTPEKNYAGTDIEFLLTDDQNIETRKTLKFYSFYEGIEDTANSSEQDFQIYPNPFQDRIFFNFNVEIASKVTIRIFDLSGVLIKTLENEKISPGIHRIAWDGRDLSGQPCPDGVYFVVIDSELKSTKLKMVKISND
ncbi:MAG: T9SS type A sorting domain-containing protein [Bacteroidales bacterium]|nr:T9SS type A sorting domain-containing protein [Bacteroidales bacterium]